MKVVALSEGPTHSIRERSCDRRLARSRNTHDHEDCLNTSEVGGGGLDHNLTGRHADIRHVGRCLDARSLDGFTIARSNHS